MTGILLVDKPADWTSHDVVAKLRGLLKERRIGHAGTLDPMATGLLTVFVGRATRAVEFAESHDKEYLAGLRLGVTTDTQDITGSILESSDKTVSEAELGAALCAFRGVIRQVPPMYSAIKINGQKLYELARRGKTVERREREVSIQTLELEGVDAQGDWILRIRCSKGTYVRTLCEDIGKSLGCGGCMSALRRTRVGGFSVDQAHTLDEIQACAQRGEVEKLLLPVENIFAEYPKWQANDAQTRRIRCGNPVPAGLDAGRYRAYGADGVFLALSESDGQELRAVKSFFEI